MSRGWHHACSCIVLYQGERGVPPPATMGVVTNARLMLVTLKHEKQEKQQQQQSRSRSRRSVYEMPFLPVTHPRPMRGMGTARATWRTS